MLRRLFGVVLVVLGLAAAGLGVASATVWREPDSVVATATPRGDGTLVVTDPGVLELIASDVTVVATVPGGGAVTVAIGRDLDVDGWIGIDHYTRVAGLTDWTMLSSSAVEPEIPAPAEGEEAPAPGVGANPAGNDMWVAEASGEGSVSLRWTDRPGRWSLIAAGVGEDAQAPTVELTWPRPSATPYLWPAVGGGAALVVVGLLTLLLGRGKRRARAAAAAGDAAAVTAANRAADLADGPAADATASESDASPGAATVPRDSTEGDSPFTGGVPSPAGSWSMVTRAERRAASAGADGEPQTDTDADADTVSADEEEAQRPARSAPRSRRSRRRAAEEATEGAAPDNASPGSPAAADASPVAPEEPAPAGRRRALTPVFGGPTTPKPSAPPAHAEAPGSPDTTATGSTEPGQGEQPTPDKPVTVTGSMPRLTRRELRAQEEARRAAEQTGIAGRLRALTGQIPAVRPGQSAPPPADPAVPPARASRSQAWRQAWGFDPEAGTPGNPDNDAEGGAR